MRGNTVVAFLSAHARCVLGQLGSCTLRGRVGAPITLRDRRRAARTQESANKRRKSWFQRFVSNSSHLHLESAPAAHSPPVAVLQALLARQAEQLCERATVEGAPPPQAVPTSDAIRSRDDQIRSTSREPRGRSSMRRLAAPSLLREEPGCSTKTLTPMSEKSSAVWAKR